MCSARVCLVAVNVVTVLAGLGLVGFGVWLLVSDADALLCPKAPSAPATPGGSSPSMADTTATMPMRTMSPAANNSGMELIKAGRAKICEITNMLRLAGALLVAIGGVLALVSIVGCCGAYNESRLLLTLYAVILILVAVALLVGAIMVFLNKSETLMKTREGLSKLLLFELRSGQRVLLPVLEDNLGCCGVNGSTDYGNATKAMKAPEACRNALTKVPGCADALVQWLAPRLSILAWSCVALVVILAVLVICAIYSCRTYRSVRNYSS